MAVYTPPRSLGVLLLTLPQELYDEIYDLTFTAPPGAVLEAWEDPSCEDERIIRIDQGSVGQRQINQNLLSVSRATRAKYAASYYGGEGAIFAVAYAIALRQWTDSLPAKHLQLLREIRYLCCMTRDPEYRAPSISPGERVRILSALHTFWGVRDEARGKVVFTLEHEYMARLGGYELQLVGGNATVEDPKTKEWMLRKDWKG